MATASEWLAASRPRTLPAAVVPVVVGIATAHAYAEIHVGRSLLALAVALLIQVGTNYANDYSDGVRGTDHRRVGPVRLTASGLARPNAVRNAAFLSFATAAMLGLVASLMTSPYLLVVGAASIAAGWYYTGGRRPYGYAGYGELFVFVFFGLVAVVGSTYVAGGVVPAFSFLAAVPIGLLITALLVVNNLRDIPTDEAAGKRTLAVVLGDRSTRALYLACVAVAYLALLPMAMLRPPSLIALISLPAAWRPSLLVLGGGTGRALVPALQGTGALILAFGFALAVGIAW